MKIRKRLGNKLGGFTQKRKKNLIYRKLNNILRNEMSSYMTLNNMRVILSLKESISKVKSGRLNNDMLNEYENILDNIMILLESDRVKSTRVVELLMSEVKKTKEYKKWMEMNENERKEWMIELIGDKLVLLDRERVLMLVKKMKKFEIYISDSTDRDTFLNFCHIVELVIEGKMEFTGKSSDYEEYRDLEVDTFRSLRSTKKRRKSIKL